MPIWPLSRSLLFARLPWLERVLGFDGLTVWHRLNGKICLYLVLAHVVFITVGYASMDQGGNADRGIAVARRTIPA